MVGNVCVCCADISSCKFFYEYEEFKIYFIVVEYMVSKAELFFKILLLLIFPTDTEMLLRYIHYKLVVE